MIVSMFISTVLLYLVPAYVLFTLFDRMELEGRDLQIGMTGAFTPILNLLILLGVVALIIKLRSNEKGE